MGRNSEKRTEIQRVRETAISLSKTRKKKRSEKTRMAPQRRVKCSGCKQEGSHSVQTQRMHSTPSDGYAIKTNALLREVRGMQSEMVCSGRAKANV